MDLGYFKICLYWVLWRNVEINGEFRIIISLKNGRLGYRGNDCVINKLQKALWILSSGAPILVTFSIAWYVTQSTYMISAFFIAISVILIIIAAAIFYEVKTKLASLGLRAKKVTQNDKCIIGYILSYLLPFASIVFDKYNPYLFLGVALLIFIVALVAYTPTANPLLFLIGYHFYDVETENGIGNYLVISKKAIRNKSELKKAIRVTEYLLIDVSGGK